MYNSIQDAYVHLFITEQLEPCNSWCWRKDGSSSSQITVQSTAKKSLLMLLMEVHPAKSRCTSLNDCSCCTQSLCLIPWSRLPSSLVDVIWPHVGLLDSCYYCRWFTGECRNVAKANAHSLSPLMGGVSLDWTWQDIFVKNCILFAQCDCSGYILIVERHSFFRFWAIFENYCKIFDVKICCTCLFYSQKYRHN